MFKIQQYETKYNDIIFSELHFLKMALKSYF